MEGNTRQKALDILRLDEDATPEEIKTNYKKLALEIHPDKNRDDPEATIKFQRLGEAYQFLQENEEEDFYDEEYFDDYYDDEDDFDLIDLLRLYFHLRSGGSGFYFNNGNVFEFEGSGQCFCMEGCADAEDQELEKVRKAKIREMRAKQKCPEDDYVYVPQPVNKKSRPAKAEKKVPEVIVPKKKTKKQLEAEERRRQKEREEIAQEIEVQQKREAEKEAKRLEKEKQKQEELRRAAFSNVVYIPTTKPKKQQSQTSSMGNKQKGKNKKKASKDNGTSSTIVSTEGKSTCVGNVAREENASSRGSKTDRRPSLGRGVIKISTSFHKTVPVYKEQLKPSLKDCKYSKPMSFSEKTRSEYRVKPKEDNVSHTEPPRKLPHISSSSSWNNPGTASPAWGMSGSSASASSWGRPSNKDSEFGFPKNNLTSSDFASNAWTKPAPVPQENYWDSRKSFCQSAMPVDEQDEERMLQAALEMSRLQEQEDKLRLQMDLEEKEVEALKKAAAAAQILAEPQIAPASWPTLARNTVCSGESNLNQLISESPESFNAREDLDDFCSGAWGEDPDEHTNILDENHDNGSAVGAAKMDVFSGDSSSPKHPHSGDLAECPPQASLHEEKDPLLFPKTAGRGRWSWDDEEGPSIGWRGRTSSALDHEASRHLSIHSPEISVGLASPVNSGSDCNDEDWEHGISSQKEMDGPAKQQGIPGSGELMSKLEPNITDKIDTDLFVNFDDDSKHRVQTHIADNITLGANSCKTHESHSKSPDLQCLQPDIDSSARALSYIPEVKIPSVETCPSMKGITESRLSSMGRGVRRQYGPRAKARRAAEEAKKSLQLPCTSNAEFNPEPPRITRIITETGENVVGKQRGPDFGEIPSRTGIPAMYEDNDNPIHHTGQSSISPLGKPDGATRKVLGELSEKLAGLKMDAILPPHSSANEGNVWNIGSNIAEKGSVPEPDQRPCYGMQGQGDFRNPSSLITNNKPVSDSDQLPCPGDQGAMSQGEDIENKDPAKNGNEREPSPYSPLGNLPKDFGAFLGYTHPYMSYPMPMVMPTLPGQMYPMGYQGLPLGMSGTPPMPFCGMMPGYGMMPAGPVLPGPVFPPRPDLHGKMDVNIPASSDGRVRTPEEAAPRINQGLDERPTGSGDATGAGDVPVPRPGQPLIGRSMMYPGMPMMPSFLPVQTIPQGMNHQA